MISRRGGEALLALVLILGLSLKVAASIGVQADADSNVAGRVAAFFERHGFKAEEMTVDADLPLLSGIAGDCRVMVGVLSPQGWHRDVVRKLASPGSRMLFVFDGKTYPDQPVVRTRADHYWSQLLRYAGFKPPLRPVLGIVASPECALGDMPWNELAPLA